MKQKGGSGIEKRMVRQYLVLVLPGMIILQFLTFHLYPVRSKASRK